MNQAVLLLWSILARPDAINKSLFGISWSGTGVASLHS
jgi:hypothetical protein